MTKSLLPQAGEGKKTNKTRNKKMPKALISEELYNELKTDPTITSDTHFDAFLQEHDIDREHDEETPYLTKTHLRILIALAKLPHNETLCWNQLGNRAWNAEGDYSQAPFNQQVFGQNLKQLVTMNLVAEHTDNQNVVTYSSIKSTTLKPPMLTTSGNFNLSALRAYDSFSQPSAEIKSDETKSPTNALPIATRTNRKRLHGQLIEPIIKQEEKSEHEDDQQAESTNTNNEVFKRLKQLETTATQTRTDITRLHHDFSEFKYEVMNQFHQLSQQLNFFTAMSRQSKQQPSPTISSSNHTSPTKSLRSPPGCAD